MYKIHTRNSSTIQKVLLQIQGRSSGSCYSLMNTPVSVDDMKASAQDLVQVSMTTLKAKNEVDSFYFPCNM